MHRPMLPNFPTISQVLDDFLGEPLPEEVEEVRETFREMSEKGEDGNTVIV